MPNISSGTSLKEIQIYGKCIRGHYADALSLLYKLYVGKPRGGTPFYLKHPRASEKLSPYVCHVKAWSAFLKPLIKKASDYERCKAFHAIIRMSENAHDSTCFSICKRTRKNTHGLL